MSQPLQIQLPDVKKWLGQETTPLIEPLKDKASNILEEVKERIEDTIQSSKKILEKSEGEMSKTNPKTYRFARNANKFAQNLTEAMNAVAVPEDLHYEKLQTFCGELEKMYASLEQLRRGAYPYISPYFIFDRRRLDVSYKRLSDIVKELRNFLSARYTEVKTIEDVDPLVDKLSHTISEIQQSQEKRKQTGEKERALEKDLVETEQKIKQLQSKVELDELVKLNQTIRELREKVKHSLRYLQKPFRKLQSLSRTPKVVIPLDELNKLDSYLRDPFMALATEENGYPLLKNILRKLDATMAEGKLKLKSSRLRKAQDQMESALSKDSLSGLQKDCKEAVSQRRSLITSETVGVLQKQLKGLQINLKELKKEKEFASSRSKALENEHEKLKERIAYLRNELEKTVFQLTDKNVQIILTS